MLTSLVLWVATVIENPERIFGDTDIIDGMVCLNIDNSLLLLDYSSRNSLLPAEVRSLAPLVGRDSLTRTIEVPSSLSIHGVKGIIGQDILQQYDLILSYTDSSFRLESLNVAIESIRKIPIRNDKDKLYVEVGNKQFAFGKIYQFGSISTENLLNKQMWSNHLGEFEQLAPYAAAKFRRENLFGLSLLRNEVIQISLRNRSVSGKDLNGYYSPAAILCDLTDLPLKAKGSTILLTDNLHRSSDLLVPAGAKLVSVNDKSVDYFANRVLLNIDDFNEELVTERFKVSRMVFKLDDKVYDWSPSKY